MTRYFLTLLFILNPTLSLGVSPLEIEKEVGRVDQLRQSLVQGVPKEATAATFKQVCSPVGLTIGQIYKDKKIKIRQASHKARNLKNAATADEMFAIEMFRKRKDLNSMWLNISGKKHYFQKIVVQKKCLSCHGVKAKRPDFIKKKYPKDQAFGFKVGDLRGVYHVEEGHND